MPATPEETYKRLEHEATIAVEQIANEMSADRKIAFLRGLADEWEVRKADAEQKIDEETKDD